MKKHQPQPLRNLVMTLVVVLVCITWATASRDVIYWWETWSHADQTTGINLHIDELLQAGQNLAFERGRTNVLLNAPDPAGADNLEFIAARRTAVTKSMEPVIMEPGILAYPMGQHMREEYALLLDLRKEVDAALALPLDQRSSGLATRWLATLSNLISDTGELVSMMALTDERNTAGFRSLSRMKVLAFELRDILGVEASRIAAGVSSGKVLSAMDMELIQNLRGQSDTIWKSLKRESRISRNPAAESEILRVDREFYQTFRPLQNSVLDYLKAGKPSPISTSDLTAASVPALDSIARFMGVLSAQTTLMVMSHLDSSRQSLMISLTLAFIALIAGILVVLTSIFRLFIPLYNIGKQLEQLAKGNMDAHIQPVGRNDEMTRGYSSVIAFRDSLVERNKLEARLMQLSNSDGLTGLANRRFLDETLNQEWQRCLRSGQTLALVIFDVDHFKMFNDLQGHLAGDECLKSIARVLSEHARRPGDLAARYGGEEFVAVLPGLTLDQASTWAEHARQAIHALAIPHPVSPTGTVTLSAGVASLVPSRDTSVPDLIHLADQQLYRAKSRGRNRVMSSAS